MLVCRLSSDALVRAILIARASITYINIGAEIDRENSFKGTGNLEPKVRLTIEASRFCIEFGYYLYTYLLRCAGVWTPFYISFVLKSSEISSN